MLPLRQRVILYQEHREPPQQLGDVDNPTLRNGGMAWVVPLVIPPAVAVAPAVEGVGEIIVDPVTMLPAPTEGPDHEM